MRENIRYKLISEEKHIVCHVSKAKLTEDMRQWFKLLMRKAFSEKTGILGKIKRRSGNFVLYYRFEKDPFSKRPIHYIRYYLKGEIEVTSENHCIVKFRIVRDRFTVYIFNALMVLITILYLGLGLLFFCLIVEEPSISIKVIGAIISLFSILTPFYLIPLLKDNEKIENALSTIEEFQSFFNKYSE